MNDERLLKSANWYATERAWPVFPLHSVRDGACSCRKADCDSPAKHPHTANGLKDATTDPAVIRQWRGQWADANVGVRTGSQAGIIVVDIDPRHGGDESVTKLERQYGEVPATVECLTGGGGRHLYYDHPGGTIRNRTKLAGLGGIDVRGDGGYVVAPPSVHISGDGYRWRDEHGPYEIAPVPAPPWLLELLRPVDQSTSSTCEPQSANDDERALLIQAVTQYVAKATSASQGGRNDAAFSLAGHLAAFQTEGGRLRLTEAQVLDLLRTGNHRNQPPLAEGELTKVVKSAMSNGTARKPHVVTTDGVSSVSTSTRPQLAHPKTGVSLPLTRPEPFRRFPVHVLPDPIRTLVRRGAAAMGCDPSFIALPALSAAASVIGNSRRIQLKRGWT